MEEDDENYMSRVQNQEIVLLHPIPLMFDLNSHNGSRMSIMLKVQGSGHNGKQYSCISTKM